MRPSSSELSVSPTTNVLADSRWLKLAWTIATTSPAAMPNTMPPTVVPVTDAPTPAVPIAGIAGVNSPFPGEAFRNLSIPTTAVDGNGTVYVAVASLNAQGTPLLPQPARARPADQVGRHLDRGAAGRCSSSKKANNLAGVRTTRRAATGSARCRARTSSCSSRPTAGAPTPGPVRVNQDPRNGDADQFQPWMAVTESGQINISFFDRRNDPSNYFIDTYLARSEDGGATWTDRRASQRMWDPAVNAPTSVSGKFIGDYQGLVADDNLAIPFWNDTQLNNLPASDPEHSPYQEVFAARIPQGPDETETPAPHALLRQVAEGRPADDRPPAAARDPRSGRARGSDRPAGPPAASCATA